MDETNDYEIWNFCSEAGFILVSKDADFLHLANRPDEKGFLLWVRIGNCRNQALLNSFDLALPGLRTAFLSGDRIVELR
jgi:predicted nuclease of predicted toxin-antitoxin system